MKLTQVTLVGHHQTPEANGLDKQVFDRGRWRRLEGNSDMNRLRTIRAHLLKFRLSTLLTLVFGIAIGLVVPRNRDEMRQVRDRLYPPHVMVRMEVIDLPPEEFERLPLTWQQKPGNWLSTDDPQSALTAVRSLIDANRAAVVMNSQMMSRSSQVARVNVTNVGLFEVAGRMRWNRQIALTVADSTRNLNARMDVSNEEPSIFATASPKSQSTSRTIIVATPYGVR